MERDEIDDEIEALEERLGMKGDLMNEDLLYKELKDDNLFELFSSVDNIIKNVKVQNRKSGADGKNKEKGNSQEEKNKSAVRSRQESQRDEVDQEEKVNIAKRKPQVAQEKVGGYEGRLDEILVYQMVQNIRDNKHMMQFVLHNLSHINKRKIKGDVICISLLASMTSEKIVAKILEKHKDSQELGLEKGKSQDSKSKDKHGNKESQSGPTKTKPDQNPKFVSKSEKLKLNQPVRLSSNTDRIRHTSYILSLLETDQSVSFLIQYFKQISEIAQSRQKEGGNIDSKTSPDTFYNYGLYIVYGLYLLDICSHDVLVDVLKYIYQKRTLKLDTMVEKEVFRVVDGEVHLVLKTIRKKDPAAFKATYEVILTQYKECSTGVLARLQDHYYKLMNNMDISGQSPFEISQSALKIIESIRKKKAKGIPSEAKPFSNFNNAVLEHVDNQTTPDAKEIQGKKASEGESNDVSLRKGGKNKEVEGKEYKRDNKQLSLLADKLDIVTQIENKVLDIVHDSNDYIDVVDRIIRMETRGGENKEAAYVVLKLCLNEKRYNKYYSEIADKLISIRNEFAYSFQLCLWDEVATLDENTPGNVIIVLSRFISRMIVKSHLDLKFFKFMDVSPLPLPVARLCRYVFDSMLKEMDKPTLVAFGGRLKKSKQVGMDTVGNIRKIFKYIQKREVVDSEGWEKATRVLKAMPQDEFDFDMSAHADADESLL